MSSPIRKLGVEEEFHLVDTSTHSLVPSAAAVLARLPRESFVPELQSSVVEVNSGVHQGLDSLRAELEQRRAELCAAAEAEGVSVAAAGTMPLEVPESLDVTDTQRFREMAADYELLAREQMICGTQVHVDVDNRDEGVRVAVRMARFLPIFLALSASSPFATDGSDTGYASSRTLVWSRWPTTGPAVQAPSAEEYDRRIEELVASGVISDRGMVYFDIRPSDTHPTVELRVCDSCPSVDSIVLVAGLFRALVQRAAANDDGGRAELPVLDASLQRAAMWRAARSGLEGDLVDPWTGLPRPAADVIGDLVELLRPELEEAGDFELVRRLVADALHAGSSAFRQRRALRRRGRIDDVVALLVAETAGSLSPGASAEESGVPALLEAYVPLEGMEEDLTYDEAVDDTGTPREQYQPLIGALQSLGVRQLRNRQIASERGFRVEGVTFRVKGQRAAQVFPWDVVPRIIDAGQWDELDRGLSQRARALDAFLGDIYSGQEIVRAGLLPVDMLDRTPGFRLSGRAARGGEVRAHIMGADLVCDGPGRWMILEDNARMPSGAAYVAAQRASTRTHFPELFDGVELRDPAETFPMIRDTLLAAAPPAAGDDATGAVVTAGRSDSGWYEQRTIAYRCGLELATPDQLLVEDNRVWKVADGERTRLDVLYVRMEEEMLLTSRGVDGQMLRGPLFEVLFSGGVTVANAFGNGVADDKAIYAYVPKMIEFYLGEKQLLEQVPTYLCSDREQRDLVIERLDQLVVKPIDGYGGAGITIGPECTAEELDERREELLVQPERYIAQEVVGLSTLPTFDGLELQRRHVDLRAFVHLRRSEGATSAHVVPSALTRVAPAGSMIVNSSRGGSGKDTWITV